MSKDSKGKWQGGGKPASGEPINLWVQGSSVYMSDLK
jgi:hypothetical protein